MNIFKKNYKSLKGKIRTKKVNIAKILASVSLLSCLFSNNFVNAMKKNFIYRPVPIRAVDRSILDIDIDSDSYNDSIIDEYMNLDFYCDDGSTFSMTSKAEPLPSFSDFQKYLSNIYEKYKENIFDDDINIYFPINVRVFLTVIYNFDEKSDIINKIMNNIMNSSTKNEFIENLKQFQNYNKNEKLNLMVEYIAGSIEKD